MENPAQACFLTLIAVTLGVAFGFSATAATINLEPAGSFRTGVFDKSASEIAAYHAKTKRLYVVNGAEPSLDILDIADPTNPTLYKRVDLSGPHGDPTSVAIHGDLVAVSAVHESRLRGQVAFFNPEGEKLNEMYVGIGPDMVCFTPDGNYVLTANEGEPLEDYRQDPEGTVTVIKIPDDIKKLNLNFSRDTAGFQKWQDAPPNVRFTSPNDVFALDCEPEYITVSPDSKKAWVTLQENNAIAIIDIEHAATNDLIGLGTKDHSLPGNGLDASDKDGKVNITNWPVHGMYMPDAIAYFETGGRGYLLTANEGESRKIGNYTDEVRVGDIKLDSKAFPNAAELQKDAALGRLYVDSKQGDTDGDGDFDELYSLGGRSIAIWTLEGDLVWDSGDDLESIIADKDPKHFNSNNDDNHSFDTRSDNKGPEPEGLAVATLAGHTYAFVGLERQGGIAVYDVTNPVTPELVTYNNEARDFGGDPYKDTAGDLGPEGLLFIPAESSPTGIPLLVVCNEVSGSTTLYLVIVEE